MIGRRCYSPTALGSNLTVVVGFVEIHAPETAVAEGTDAALA